MLQEAARRWDFQPMGLLLDEVIRMNKRNFFILGSMQSLRKGNRETTRARMRSMVGKDTRPRAEPRRPAPLKRSPTPSSAVLRTPTQPGKESWRSPCRVRCLSRDSWTKTRIATANFSIRWTSR